MNYKHNITLLEALVDVSFDWGSTMPLLTATDASSCSVNAWICTSNMFS